MQMPIAHGVWSRLSVHTSMKHAHKEMCMYRMLSTPCLCSRTPGGCDGGHTHTTKEKKTPSTLLPQRLACTHVPPACFSPVVIGQ